MAWFRHRRSTIDRTAPGDGREHADEPAREDDASPAASGTVGAELVPLVSGASLARTERSLKMLAAQSQQLHGHIVQLEHRVDALSEALLDRLDVPTHDDLLRARMHSARVAAELARLEVNLAARLDAVRDQLRAVHDEPASAEIDLRVLTPHDTGWTPAH